MLQEILGVSAKGKYLEAIICQYLDRPTEMRAAIIQAFELEPDNREILRHIRLLLEDSGHYKELADAMAIYLYSTGQGSSYNWTTLSECYLQAGQLSEALHATAQDSIEIMRNRTYLFLYNKAKNYERQRQAWRKYRTDCRGMLKSCYLKWPVDEVGGIIEYEMQTSSFEHLSTVMGQQEKTSEDFPRYWRALRPDDRDMKNMAAGLAAVYSRAGQAEQVLAELQRQEKTKTAQIPKVQTLRSELMAQLPAPSTEAELDAMVRKTEITDWPRWNWIARAYLEIDQTAKAGRILAWSSLNRWIESPTDKQTWSTLREDFAAYHKADPNSWAEIRVAFEPVPMGYLNASTDAKLLDWRVQNAMDENLGPKIDAIESRFKGPGPCQSLPLRQALIAYHLRHGDLGRATEHLIPILSGLDQVYNPIQVIDFPRVIERCDDSAVASQFLIRSGETIDRLLNEGRLPDRAAIPHLAMLAIAFDKTKNLSARDEIFAKIASLLAEPSQTALWLIDALERCGKSAEAETWFEQLKRDGLLPLARIQDVQTQTDTRKERP